ncbi:MAG: hypothetical protein KAX20_05255 [Candidatus Omnitrophica bacterium]|nr:hypothetical protein [Candidatus Omnitrophota bacterium]
MFKIIQTNLVKEQLEVLKRNKGLEKRYKAVVKSIKLLARNPRHPGLHTHEYSSLQGPNGEKVFEVYAESLTSAAYRIFWYYGPERKQITIISIIPHP